jgi:hypothetical protein
VIGAAVGARWQRSGWHMELTLAAPLQGLSSAPGRPRPTLVPYLSINLAL